MAILVNWCNNILFPLLRQVFLIPNKINKFMNFRTQFSPSCMNKFYGNLINTWRNIIFRLTHSWS
jgi:hypothetical protein